MRLTLFSIALILMLIPRMTNAQKIFSEGIIKFNVYINNETKASGLYVISVKSGNVKRELAMNNGYSNITLFFAKTGKTFSYNLSDENKYALEMTVEELREKNKKFENAQFKEQHTSKKIAGYNCAASRVSYLNKEDAEFFYTTDLLAPSENFNAMFPGLKGIPLEYEVKSANNMSFKFVATLVDPMVIDSKIFTLPADFKIVTKNEVEKLK